MSILLILQKRRPEGVISIFNYKIKFEKIYQWILKSVFGFLNPFKKIIINTECQVHKHLNEKALIILKNDKYMNQYSFFNNFIEEINEGAVWADQDFKSSNHFYNPYKKKEDYTAGAMR